MLLYDNDFYMNDIRDVCNLKFPWNRLKNKSIMISGATGLIGSFLIDVILEKNIHDNLNCSVFVLGRSELKAKERFAHYFEDSHMIFIPYDVKEPLYRNEMDSVDYIIHLASNTHPLQYSTDPIGTIETNVLGAKHLLDFAVEHKTRRFVFASSNEIYGENRGDVEFFEEDYCGYINCNTLRAGYPESKRCGEALCQAYKAEKGLDVVIARFTRLYGPTMNMDDSKAISQFIKKSLTGEDIILKSSGCQFYSFLYVADAVSGLLTVLLCGENGEAYNISDEQSDIMLKDLAGLITEINGGKVVYEKPDEIESAGYSKVTKARLNSAKLKSLGWEPKYDITTGMKQTIRILKATK